MRKLKKNGKQSKVELFFVSKDLEENPRFWARTPPKKCSDPEFELVC
jgi:hypothetical protein